MIELLERPPLRPTPPTPSPTRTRRQLTEHGYVCVEARPHVASMAAGLATTVPALLAGAGAATRFDAVADTCAGSRQDRADVTWSRRRPDDPRGAKLHLQVPMGFAQRVRQDRGAPALMCHVLFRLEMLAVEACRLLADHLGDVGLRCTVRANVYEAAGTVPPHVDESAFTVVFTDRPGALHAAPGDGGAEPAAAVLAPVPATGWCAVLMAGELASSVLPGLAPTPHAAMADGDGRRLSISVFATPAGR